MVKGVHHICMKVEDVDKAVQFYTGVMEYKVRAKWEGGALLVSPDGTHLEFFPIGEDGEKSYAHVAYNVENVDEVYQKAIAAGCEEMTTPRDVELPSNPPLPVRIAFYKDPTGNVVELFHEK